MVTMKDIRDVVLLHITVEFSPFKILGMEDDGISTIEIMSKPGYPAIIIDFGEQVEIYRSSEPDLVKTLNAADPDFICHLKEALDHFYVPRR